VISVEGTVFEACADETTSVRKSAINPTEQRQGCLIMSFLRSRKFEHSIIQRSIGKEYCHPHTGSRYISQPAVWISLSYGIHLRSFPFGEL
jgi:hypothetical protein